MHHGQCMTLSHTREKSKKIWLWCCSIFKKNKYARNHISLLALACLHQFTRPSRVSHVGSLSCPGNDSSFVSPLFLQSLPFSFHFPLHRSLFPSFSELNHNGSTNIVQNQWKPLYMFTLNTFSFCLPPPRSVFPSLPFFPLSQREHELYFTLVVLLYCISQNVCVCEVYKGYKMNYCYWKSF